MRIGVFIPCTSATAAESVKKCLDESSHGLTGLRVARLRDRTGPSVAARLAHLETEHAALVVRVGELERLPEPGPRMSDRAERERLFLLRDRAACGCLFADCTKHGAFYYVTEADRLEAQSIAAEFAGEPAPVRPEPGSVAEPTPEQIKVYLRGEKNWWPYDEGEGWIYRRTWFATDSVEAVARAEKRTPAEMRARILASSSTTAEDPDRLAKVAHRAEIDKHLARPYTGQEWDALLPQGRDRLRRIAAAVAEACADDAPPRRTAEEERADVVAMLDDQEVYARKHERPSADAYLHARVRVANGEHVGAAARSATKPTAPNATRDPLTDPREGDWFVDRDGAVREVIGRDGSCVTFCINGMSPNDLDAASFSTNRINWGGRPMTPAEAADFRRDGTRPSATTPIVRVPTESAGADGARLVQSEAEMAAKLRKAGWRHTQRWGWVAPGDGNTTIWTTADAHAAMRAAKGAK